MKFNPFKDSKEEQTKQIVKLILGGGITWAGFKAFEALWEALSIPHAWRVPLYFIIFVVLIVAYIRRDRISEFIGRVRESMPVKR